MSYKKYRDRVLRDLEWLLNTEGALLPENLAASLLRSNREGTENFPDLREYPYAFRSVINYGLRQFWGVTDREKVGLQDQFAEAIQLFEPRIAPGTLSVYVLNPGEEPGQKGNSQRLEGNVATLVIHGELWANPLPEHLNLKTTLDLEVGECLLGDAPHGSTPPRTV
jgi:type VI secretion system protein ImpF